MFEILPANTILWFYDFDFVSERISELYEKAILVFEASSSALKEEDDFELKPEEFFIDINVIARNEAKALSGGVTKQSPDDYENTEVALSGIPTRSRTPAIAAPM